MHTIQHATVTLLEPLSLTNNLGCLLSFRGSYKCFHLIRFFIQLVGYMFFWRKEEHFLKSLMPGKNHGVGTQSTVRHAGKIYHQWFFHHEKYCEPHYPLFLLFLPLLFMYECTMSTSLVLFQSILWCTACWLICTQRSRLDEAHTSGIEFRLFA